jgi:hypothetical protein
MLRRDQPVSKVPSGTANGTARKSLWRLRDVASSIPTIKKEKLRSADGSVRERNALNASEIFHGLFYGLRNFGCKMAQFYATRRKSDVAETPSVSNGAQAGENARKNSFLNYKSAALTS